MLKLQHQLIGEVLLLPQSKTKEVVVHVGPSLPLDQWRELMPSQLETSFPSQSSNWLIAQKHTEISDVMVVLWTTPSNILKVPLLKLKLLTHMLELDKLAFTQLAKANSKSLVSLMLKPMTALH